METPSSKHPAEAVSHSPGDAPTQQVPIFERIAAGFLFLGYGVMWSGFLASFYPLMRRVENVADSGSSTLMLVNNIAIFGMPKGPVIKRVWLLGLHGTQAILELLMWGLLLQAGFRMCGAQGFMRYRRFWWGALVQACGYIFIINARLLTMNQPLMEAPYELGAISPLWISLALAVVAFAMLCRTRASRLDSED